MGAFRWRRDPAKDNVPRPGRDAADGTPAAQAEPAPRLAHTPSKYMSRNHEESSGHVDLDVARGSAASLSPMGVDLSQHSGALSRKLQMHGHHAGSFTLPPKPQEEHLYSMFDHFFRHVCSHLSRHLDKAN